MSVTVLEGLQNADANLGNGMIGLMLAKEQLHNAVALLVKGYSLNDEVEPLLDEYGEVENVPYKTA
jgi:hypothetical protein